MNTARSIPRNVTTAASHRNLRFAQRTEGTFFDSPRTTEGGALPACYLRPASSLLELRMRRPHSDPLIIPKEKLP
jgi:hypothetical protein